MSADADKTALSDERLAMLAALVNGDVSLAYRLATELPAQGVGFDEIVGSVFGPVQAELGARWAAGDIVVADEHAASAAVEDLIIRLGATVEAPTGPAVVVAAAERDTHALGARCGREPRSPSTASVCCSSVHRSLPRTSGTTSRCSSHSRSRSSCSIGAAISGARRCVAVAHEVGIPVVCGGRAQRVAGAGVRCGRIRALAARRGRPLRTWSLGARVPLAPGPPPVPEQRSLEDRSHRLIATALEAVPNGEAAKSRLGEELARLLYVVDGALVLDDREVVAEHVAWLRTTGPAHGLAPRSLEAALHALATGMDGDLARRRRAAQRTVRPQAPCRSWAASAVRNLARP